VLLNSLYFHSRAFYYEEGTHKAEFDSMTLRFGIVGWGEIAQDHAKHIIANGGHLTAVVSRRRNLDIGVPVYSSVQEALPSVDAVTIAVPNHLHASVCIEVMKAGKAVMVEKPICISAPQLEALESNLPQARMPVHVGYRLRFNPSMVRLRNRLKSPKLIKCSYRMGLEQLAKDKPWTRDHALSGGAFFTLGVHMLDLARWLAKATGKPLTNLKATADGYEDFADFPLNASLTGRLPSGVKIIAGTDLRGDADSKIDIVVEAEQDCYPDPALPMPQPADENVEYTALFRNFIEAIRKQAIDQEVIREVLQTHRELIRARELVG
jgi:predicted dehydrogenase